MTRVLVVHHDLDLAGQEADSLRRYGYEVVECGGPTRNRCPVLSGRPCDLAERADVLVYDSWASGDSEGARSLIENIREIHPDTPVVLTSLGLPLSWEETSGEHAVTVLTGQPTGARLDQAIRTAMATAQPAQPVPTGAGDEG
jgi:hypothetical protein